VDVVVQFGDGVAKLVKATVCHQTADVVAAPGFESIFLLNGSMRYDCVS
jgi:hypothetical protein